MRERRDDLVDLPPCLRIDAPADRIELAHSPRPPQRDAALRDRQASKEPFGRLLRGTAQTLRISSPCASSACSIPPTES